MVCRRVKRALRPKGQPPHEKRYASVISLPPREKSVMHTRPALVRRRLLGVRGGRAPFLADRPSRRSTRAHIFLRKPRKQCENVLQTPERVI